MMETHKIVVDAKLEFEVEADHEVVALSKIIMWLCDALTTTGQSPLKAVGLNLGIKQE